MKPHAALALDIGGTSLRAALVDHSGQIQAHALEPTPADGDPEPLLARLEQLTRHLTATREPECRVLGVAMPGIYDQATGVLRRAVNLPRLEGLEIRRLLEQRLQRPVRIETDVNAAGVAQHAALQPPPARMVYLALGTGVGGCVLLDRTLLRHTRGGAGHLGHLVVDSTPDAPRCKCGARGCLEAVLAHSRAAAAVALHAPDAPITVNAADAALVAAIGVALVQFAHLYAPDVILLGGGVCDYQPALLDAARAAFEARRGSLAPRNLQVRAAPLRSDVAGVIGAALTALACGNEPA